MTAFQVMSAASELPKDKDISFPCMASFKLDGIRSPIIEGVPMSRKMIPCPNLFYQKWVMANRAHLEGIDCEVIVGKPHGVDEFGRTVFSRTSSGIGSVSGEPDFKIYVFDAFDINGVKLPAATRVEMLKAWYANLPQQVKERTVLLEQFWIKTIEELNTLMAHALKIGYEGLVLKRPDLLYKNGRSSITSGELLKWKEFIDDEALVLGLKQAKTNNNPLIKDALGHAKRSLSKAGMALVDSCSGFHCWSKKFGTFEVGLGHQSAVEAKALWDARLHWDNCERVITFTYQPYGTKDKPRFAAFKCERPAFDIENPTVNNT